MSTLSIGFPPSHYAVASAFIDFTIDHHMDLDAKLIKGNFLHPLYMRRIKMF
jgi:hypothetical protein